MSDYKTKIRCMFEKFCEGHFYLSELSLDWNTEDGYEDTEVQTAFESFSFAWSKSRESLVIELPISEVGDGCGDYYDTIDIDDMKEALESQGIRYK